MARTRKIAARVAVIAACIVAFACPAAAQKTTDLTVMVFQGMQNLPLLAAQSQGFFAKRGLKVDIRIAPDSDELRHGLAAGASGGAVNAVASAAYFLSSSSVKPIGRFFGWGGFISSRMVLMMPVIAWSCVPSFRSSSSTRCASSLLDTSISRSWTKARTT